MKKILPLFLVMLLGFTGCAAVENEKTEFTEKMHGIEVQYAGWTIDQYLDNSECAFVGTCRSVTLTEDKYDVILEFDSITALMGEYDDSIHEFRGLASMDYQVGSEYLILCSKESSVYTDHDYYGFSIAVKEDEKGVHHEGISNFQYASLSDACEYIKAYVSSHPKDAVNKETYCNSEDPEEIYNCSDYVFVIEVTEIFDDTASDRTSYNFNVVEELKGKSGGEQWITAYKDSMTVGSKYIVMMEKPGEDAIFFTLSSKNSIFAADSAEAAIIQNLNK